MESKGKQQIHEILFGYYDRHHCIFASLWSAGTVINFALPIFLLPLFVNFCGKMSDFVSFVAKNPLRGQKF